MIMIMIIIFVVDLDEDDVDDAELLAQVQLHQANRMMMKILFAQDPQF